MANNNSDIIIGLEYARILPVSLCTFGVIAHVFLIVAFIKDPLKCFRNSGTYLVGNLAISDLLTCLISPTFYFFPHFLGTWCSVLLFVTHVGAGVSIFTIAAISIDRFLLTVHPMKYRVLVKGKLIVVWLACTWLLSSGPPAKVFLFPSNNADDVVFFCMKIFAGTSIVLSSVMYWLTYHKLKKQSRNFSLESINLQVQSRVMKEKYFLRTIILIACIQIACVVPVTILFNYYTLEALFIDGPFARILNRLFGGLFYVNFAVNPVVYVWRLRNYRRTFYLLYCCRRQYR